MSMSGRASIVRRRRARRRCWRACDVAAACRSARWRRRRRDRATAAPEARRLPGVPGGQRVEHRTCRSCRCARDSATLVEQHQRDRRTHEAAPRLRRRRRVRHPVQGRAVDPAEACRSTTPRTATRAIPDRSRSRRTRRSKAARRAPATGTCSSCNRGRAISTSSAARSGSGDHWDADVGVELEPRSRTSCGRRVDVGRRRGAADPARARALRRGRGGRDQPRAALHRRRARSTATSSPRRTTRRRRPNAALPPMGLRLRLKASFSLAGFHGQSLVILQGAEEVRDDRRRQRLVVVHHRRGRHALERRRPEPAEDRSGHRVRGREHRPGCTPALERRTVAAGGALECWP